MIKKLLTLFYKGWVWFWKFAGFYGIETYYEFENQVSESSPVEYIRIARGKYKGLIYHYGRVETNTEDVPTLRFEYQVIEPAAGKLCDERNSEVVELLGDILVDIMDKYGTAGIIERK